jgi:cellulose synthase (UDP-forming)
MRPPPFFSVLPLPLPARWHDRDRALTAPVKRTQAYGLGVWGFRILAVASVAAGFYYLFWRYTASLNWSALWFAIPLLLAETYGIVGNLLFAFAVWQPARHVPPPPIEGATVDVFITTYSEPVELVRRTAEAARRIHWPHLRVCILDDGSRPEVRAMAVETGCDYVTRGKEWTGKPHHAKAGNVNNALLQASGDLVLILDADQIPDPRIVEHTIGYFRDPKVAFVQTPQHFYNIPPGDPLGSDAALFYGPIQQGKDGWNAAFFCGTNAILRREALMQLGLADYAEEMGKRVERALSQIRHDLAQARANTPLQAEVLTTLSAALAQARQALAAGQPLETVTDIVRQAVSDARRTIAEDELAVVAGDLGEISQDGEEQLDEVRRYILQQLPDLAREVVDTVPLRFESVGLDAQAADDLELARADEALPVLVLPTYSVTEDMATSMRLHAMGWRSVFHPEILAQGLAPEDLASALKQRLRWAQGTIQILLREKPLRMKGLTFAQRIAYLTTMYSYFSGFSTLMLLLAPIVYLFTGTAPVASGHSALLWHLVPALVLNRLMFWLAARGIPVWRGEQYAVALFPLWIQAVISVLMGKKIQFAVTPKERQEGAHLHLVWPQLLIMGLTILAIAYGLFSWVGGWNHELAATLFSTFWGCYNMLMLSIIVRAAVYKPPPGWAVQAPGMLTASDSAVKKEVS